MMGIAGTLLLTGLTMVACGAAADDPTASNGVVGEDAPGVVVSELGKGELQPIARISGASGVKLDFFEPQPGDLFTIQWGPIGATPLVTDALRKRNLPPEELYKALSGGAAPAALSAAQKRANDLAKQKPPPGQPTSDPDTTRPPGTFLSKVVSDEIGAVSQAIPTTYDCQGAYDQHEWFYCNFCKSGKFTINWMSSTGSGNYSRYDVNSATSTVGVLGGNDVHFRVRYRKWSTWSTHLDTRVSNGYFAQSDKGLDLLDFDTQGYVDQADGDFYHWCAWGW
jgi:hypothetical protein